jgi:hypothetical protein
MWRGHHVWVAAVIGGCHPAAPPVPAARALAPLPPYGGAVVTGPCELRLDPASADERARRLAAIQSRLPAARIQLSALGDRARIIELPATGQRVTSKRRATVIAKELLRRTAAVFGIGDRASELRIEDDDGAWTVEIQTWVDETTRSSPAFARIVIRIDRETGAVKLGIVSEPLPRAVPCEHDPPVLDTARVIGAVIGRRMPGGPADRLIGPDDVVPPMLILDFGDLTVRWLALVFVGPGLQLVPTTNVEARRELVRSIITVDPTTARVVDERAVDRRFEPIADDWMDLARDPQRAFGDDR